VSLRLACSSSAQGRASSESWGSSFFIGDILNKIRELELLDTLTERKYKITEYVIFKRQTVVDAIDEETAEEYVWEGFGDEISFEPDETVDSVTELYT